MAVAHLEELRVACPPSSPRVVVPGRVVTDRPGRDVMVAAAAVAVLQWVIDRSRELRDTQTLEVIHQLSGMGRERTRTALAAAVESGYLTRFAHGGDAYTYRIVEPHDGEYVLWIDAYDFARPDVTVQQRAAYLVLLAHMQSGGETQRLCNRRMAKFLGVSPRMAGRHVASLETGMMPLLERLDTTTEGRRWRLVHHGMAARVGKARLRELLQVNQCRNPYVAGRTVPDPPLANIAPLFTATTGGGFKGLPSRGTGSKPRRSPSPPRRPRRPGSKYHQPRHLPRHRSGIQSRLDALWELVDEDTQAGRAPVGSIDTMADDLLRRFSADVVIDAMLYVRLETPKGGITSPLAAARSIARCYVRAETCQKRHHGPCGSVRRQLHRAQTREALLEREKAHRAEASVAVAVALSEASPHLLGLLLGGGAENGTRSWDDWVKSFRPAPGIRTTEAFMEQVPRQWRMTDLAWEWATVQAQHAARLALSALGPLW